MLAAALAVSSGAVAPAVPATAAPATAASAAAPAVVAEADAMARAKRTGKPVEVTAATTPTDTLTANPNGSLTLTRAAVPVRKRVGGKWTPLDATLRLAADGTVAPVATSSDLTFSGGGSQPLVTMRNSGKKLALSLPMALPRPELAGPTATYRDVLPGVDLRLTATRAGGFTQVFVIHDARAAANPALRQLDLATSTDGLTVTQDGAGNLSAADRFGHAVFSAPAPVMWDSGSTGRSGPDARAAGASSLDAPGQAPAYARVATKTTPRAIALIPDAALLTGPNTVYPVYVDPSWAPNMPSSGAPRVAYASVAEAFPSSNKWMNTADPDPDRLQLGWANTPWHARTMVNFNIDTGTLAGASISDAYLSVYNAYSGSCTAAVTRVFAPATTLNSGNATWNYWYNSVNLGAVIDAPSFSGGYNSNCPAHGVAFNVLSAVNADVAAGKTTQTFVFTGDANETSNTASYKEFSLSSMSMSITYNHTPSTPTNLTTSPQTACTGTVTTVGDGSVTLYAPVSDPDGTILGVKYEVWKSSDPANLIKSTDWNTFTTGSNTSAVLVLDEPLLVSKAGTSLTEFSWRVQVWDGFATSGLSTTCKFNFDPARPGAPSAVPPANGSTQIGQPVTIAVTKPVSGPAPASYVYQLNAGPPVSVAADANGNAGITVRPTRRTNVLSINSVSAGGNVSVDTASITFTTAPVATAYRDNDFTADGIADLVTVGAANGLGSGVWLAPGQSGYTVTTTATNLGVNGNGVVGDNRPADFDGAQVITGLFTGSGFQDVLVYYPNATATADKGTGMVIAGNGDGSPLLAQLSGNEYTITSSDLLELDDQYLPVPNTWPLQIANAGDALGTGDTTPDLIGVAGTAGNYHLNYYYYASIQNLQNVTRLTTQTPAGDMNWDQWKIATTQIGGSAPKKTDMFLWQPTTGALYLWRGLDMSTGTLAYSPYLLSASGWNTGAALTLQATDANNDNLPDLRTTTTGSVTKAWTTSSLVAGTGGANGTGTLTGRTSQTLSIAPHVWTLSDMPAGAGNGTAITSASDNPPGGTAALPLTGNSGSTWHTGDTFSPDAQFNGTSGMLATSGPAIATNGDFSVSAWVKPTSLGGTVLSQDGTNTAAFTVSSDATAKTWRFAMSRTDSVGPVWDTVSSAADTARAGVWTKVTATYRASTGLMTLAVNDTVAATGSHTTPWNATGGLRVAAAKTSAVAYGGYLTGQVANVETWAKAVTLTDPTGNVPSSIYNPANGNVEVYFNSGGRLLGRIWSPSTGWATTVDIAPTTGNPTAFYDPRVGNVEIYYPYNGGLYQAWRPAAGGTWGSGLQLASSMTGHASVGYDPATQRVQVFFNSGGLLAQRYFDGTWQPVNYITSGVVGSPRLIVDPNNNNLEVYYSSSGRINEVYLSGGTWYSSGEFGPNITGQPAVVYNPTNHNIEIYWNCDGVLKERYWSPTTGWSGIMTFAGNITGNPVVIADPRYNNNIEVYFNNDGVVKQYAWVPNSGWTPMIHIGGAITNSPAVSHNQGPSNSMDVYFNSGGVLYENFHTGSGWSGALSVGGAIS